MAQGSQGTDSARQQYVGFWLRFIAFLVDSIIASIVISPLVVMVMGEIDLTQLDMSDPVALSAQLHELTLNLSFNATLMAVFVLLFWIFKSATPGKMLFRAIIIDSRHGGKPATWQLVVRYLGYFLSTFAFGLGFLWIAFDPRKQGWHDKLAGTLVVVSPRNENA